MSREKKVVESKEYYVLNPGDPYEDGDGWLSSASVSFWKLSGDYNTIPDDGCVHLRPVPPQRMVTITYEVTEEYAESQARATRGRNDNVNRRFDACRKVTGEDPVLTEIKAIRASIKESAELSIDCARIANNADAQVEVLKRRIKELQDARH